MNGNYYSLRWSGGAPGSEEYLTASVNRVYIGQKEGCDVKLSNNGPYADELFAEIRPVVGNVGWQVIPASRFVQTQVNGAPVRLNHYLQSGDHITFSETDAEIVFEERSGERHGTETLRFASLSRRLVAISVCAALVVLGLGFWALLHDSSEKKNQALRQAEEWVFKLEVDSVLFYSGSTLEGSCRGAETGTAFLTREGKLITARHCLEPWLNVRESQYTRADEILETTHRWALKAQTGQGYTLVTKLNLRREDGSLVVSLLSSDFQMDKQADYCMELEDGLYPLMDKRKDIACLQMDSLSGKSSILLPARDQLQGLAKKRTQLHFYGFPLNEKGACTTVDGILIDYQPGERILQQIEGELVPGYSGGPVLVYRKGKVYVIGVISVLDSVSETESINYSVPVTEIYSLRHE